MTREQFALELNMTASVLPPRTELSVLALDAYWQAFRTESHTDFSRACRRAREELDYMPTIKQLRTFLPSRASRTAIEATDRYLRDMHQIAARARTTWPARIGPSDPTPVAELVGPWLEPPGRTEH